MKTETLLNLNEEQTRRLKEELNRGPSIFTDKEVIILALKSGLLFNNRKWTLQEIGDSFGITRERVRQIIDRAISKI